MNEYTRQFLDEQRGRLETMSEDIRSTLELETDIFQELMRETARKDRAEVADEDLDNRSIGEVTAVDRERVRRISSALYRLDHGEYGYCQICGSPIGEERLRAKPDALLCMYCKERREAEGESAGA
jgi:DnaK suppressor protein